MTDKIKNILINCFKRRNIKVSFFHNIEEVNRKILDKINLKHSVGIGNSKTLKEMKISKKLSERGNVVFDKTKSLTKKHSRKMKRKSLLTDYYLSGSNAISQDGYIVNVDHSGNRVAALLYGPKKVIIVIGQNKIVKSLKKAKERVRNIAAPLNALRAGYKPPCIDEEVCTRCYSEEKVCNSMVIIEGESNPNRIEIFVIEDDYGF